MSDVLGVFRGYGSAIRARTPGTFRLESPFAPAGDQATAIPALVQGVKQGERSQVLLGVTGSGKTFTMANVIQELQRTSLILAPNKTLAAQLYGEMKSFFPHNAVEYFVSYYDYYRPEAYLPSSNTYIEKEATINEHIERMRHSATRALLERTDVVVVASVSCIYGLGAIESYQGLAQTLTKGQRIPMSTLWAGLTQLSYRRNDLDFKRGTFRVRGDRVDIFPAHYENRAWRVSFFGSEIESLAEFDVLTGQTMAPLTEVVVYPNNHFVTPGPTLQQAMVGISQELEQQVALFRQEGRLIEAQRLSERVTHDLETLRATGICPGIEHYSCYLSGRPFGDPPPTLFEYLSSDSLIFVDESHVAIPQLRGMYAADRSRKTTLSEYGFRLPSCCHNRPLRFEEWEAMRPSTILVSATPGEWDLEHSSCVIEQVIRPTGLLDPTWSLHPTEGQIDHLRDRIKSTLGTQGRVMITTLTKRMAEHLAQYLTDAGFQARYLHSDLDTLERVDLLAQWRQGIFDILVGINLLREGLDIPECQLVAILDADKEGFLRSHTALIQIMGRAARNALGHVLLYGDSMTLAMKTATQETDRRRLLQIDYNTRHGLTPKTVFSSITNIKDPGSVHGAPQGSEWNHLSTEDLVAVMALAADELNFERAQSIKNFLVHHRGWRETAP